MSINFELLQSIPPDAWGIVTLGTRAIAYIADELLQAHVVVRKLSDIYVKSG